MLKFILRRTFQSLITVMGVMALTFLLFNIVSGDVSSSFLGQHATTQDRLAFKAEHHLDLPVLANIHSRLQIEDCSANKTLQLVDQKGGANVMNALGLYWAIDRTKPVAQKFYHSQWVSLLGEDTHVTEMLVEGVEMVDKPVAPKPEAKEEAKAEGDAEKDAEKNPAPEKTPEAKAEGDAEKKPVLPAEPVLEFRLCRKDLMPAEQAVLDKEYGKTEREKLEKAIESAKAEHAETQKKFKAAKKPEVQDALTSILAKQTAELAKQDKEHKEMVAKIEAGTYQATPLTTKVIFAIDMSTCKTAGDVLAAINANSANHGRLKATIPSRSISQVFTGTQFYWHLRQCVTFSGVSWDSKKKLSTLIVQRGPYSLALTIPGLALGWFSAMIISCFVAYYRGKLVDKLGVFLSVLGMCIPLLAYMIAGQYLMFHIRPDMAYGLKHSYNVYIPIFIGMVAGLGGSVRFYRTVILNEVNQDYVRTARAKGLPLPAILFKHVLKNCMLPIITNLIMILPFLIMGNLLLEKFFGIPGLGGLMIDSIQKRDLPIINTLTFLTAVIYTVGLLLTDILYAVFDPRIRLK
ncbi:MAG: ABC transporter permease subunit [Phycisphaerales bacterium]|jgi:peptide/nickel transport system permease protein|nr:ABC transporter permease subunit [Phycisphaerales bacterium]